jgi:hypothetical protein
VVGCALGIGPTSSVRIAVNGLLQVASQGLMLVVCSTQALGGATPRPPVQRVPQHCRGA